MPVDLRKIDSPTSTKMGYIGKWKQELGIYKLKSYSPKLWTAMSFILPLMLVPLAAKAVKMGVDYAKKKKK